MPVPLLIHSIGALQYSSGVRDELSLLTSGEISHQKASHLSNRSNFIVPSRWSSPHLTSYPNFFRLGGPADIKNLGNNRTSVVLGLDARVLRNHEFQLNVGWHPNELMTQAYRNAVDRTMARDALNGIFEDYPEANIKVGELLYPDTISDMGDVIDGRTIGEADLFLKIKELDTARRTKLGLNGPGKSHHKNWAASNEILVDGPISLKESLKIVFISDALPPTYAKKIRDLVSLQYPNARVKEYKTTW